MCLTGGKGVSPMVSLMHFPTTHLVVHEYANVRTYSNRPFNTETQTLSMSVIVQPELLERVYKSKHTHSHELRNRLAEGGIHITTNTAQASGISVMLDDKHEISIYGDNLEERRAQIDHAIEEICGRRSEISGFSSYSTKVPKVVDIRSTTVNFKWRTYSSSNWPIVMPPNNHDTMRYEGFVVKEAEANPSAQVSFEERKGPLHRTNLPSSLETSADRYALCFRRKPLHSSIS